MGRKSRKKRERSEKRGGAEAERRPDREPEMARERELDELADRLQSLHQTAIDVGIAFPGSELRQLLHRIGLQERLLRRPEDVEALIKLLSFTPPQLSTGQATLQQAILRHLIDPASRELFLTLVEEPPRVLRFAVTPRRGGRHGMVVHPWSGTGWEPPEPVDEVLVPPDLAECDAGLLIGHVVAWRGARVLIGHAELPPGRLVDELPDALPARNGDWQGWQEALPAMVQAALDPQGHHVREAAASMEPSSGVLAEIVTAHVIRALDDTVVRSIRVRIDDKERKLPRFREALARNDRARFEELTRLVHAYALQRLRHLGASLDEVPERLDDPRLERLVPLADVLEPFGVRPDGSRIHLDEEDLERRPLGLLLLRDDHPLHDELPPVAPIAAAERWAAARKRQPEAKEVRDAAERYRRELRWLATWGDPDGEEASVWRGGPRYEDLRSGLQRVCDGRLAQAPLGELGLGRATQRRVERALEQLGTARRDDGTYALIALPRRSSRLLRTRGFGEQSYEDLFEALRRTLHDWRWRWAGLDRARHLRVDEVDEASREEVRSALDDLARAFGD